MPSSSPPVKGPERSPSSQPWLRQSPSDPLNPTAGVSSSPYLIQPVGTHHLPSCHFSEVVTSGQDMSSAAETSQGEPQNASIHFQVDSTGMPSEFDQANFLYGQFSHSANPSNLIGFQQPPLPQFSAPTLSPHDWIAQQPPYPLCPPHPSGLTQLQPAPRPHLPPQSFGPYGSIAPQATYPTYPFNPLGSVQSQPPLPPQHSLYPPATLLQLSSNSKRLDQLSGQHSRQLHHQNLAMFNQAHNFTAEGTFIESHVINNNSAPNQFMKELLNETIPGAASDSSARDPPPRCHPGTRLAIIQRCLDFIASCDGEKKMLWVVGAAGVGKSAIMQNVAESPLAVTYRASVFYSVYGRDDGTKTIITLSYQLAAKSELYRQIIEQEITRDPSLLQSSIALQFEKFIIEPFIHHPQLDSAGRILIIIDGLDECNNPRTQQELLRLISDFCIKYPSSPLVWLIASRPETHITSFFSRRNVMLVYEKEEILVDSDQAREDVERFLRQRLMEIRESFDLHSKWPDERDLWKLADASGGLFAYAETAVRYIGDLSVGNPASQLSDVLHVIDNHPMTGVPREEHPMALLDALYARILSNVPPKVMVNTRKILSVLALQKNRGENDFLFLCNWLGLAPDDAYSAINHLRSVLDVPRRDQAHWRELKPFHKSFIDFISDFSRSGFSLDIRKEGQQLEVQCTFRVLNEAPDGIDSGDANYYSRFGSLARGPGTDGGISLTWRPDARVKWNDKTTRLSMYKLGIDTVVVGIKNRDPIFQSEFCVRLLTTRFRHYYDGFPYVELPALVFDQSRRHKFMMCGIIKQMPPEALGFHARFTDIAKLRFRRPALTMAKLTNPWNSACKHEREGDWEDGQDQNWTTMFQWRQCKFCNKRARRQLETWKTQYADRTFPVLFTSAGKCCMEIECLDPEDGMSEWTYWFWCSLSLEERKRYG